MLNFKGVRAKCLPDLGQKWQKKKMIIFNNFTLVSLKSHKIYINITSVFLVTKILFKEFLI